MKLVEQRSWGYYLNYPNQYPEFSDQPVIFLIIDLDGEVASCSSKNNVMMQPTNIYCVRIFHLVGYYYVECHYYLKGIQRGCIVMTWLIIIIFLPISDPLQSRQQHCNGCCWFWGVCNLYRPQPCTENIPTCIAMHKKDPLRETQHAWGSSCAGFIAANSSHQAILNTSEGHQLHTIRCWHRRKAAVRPQFVWCTVVCEIWRGYIKKYPMKVRKVTNFFLLVYLFIIHRMLTWDLVVEHWLG